MQQAGCGARVEAAKVQEAGWGARSCNQVPTLESYVTIQELGFRSYEEAGITA